MPDTVDELAADAVFQAAVRQFLAHSLPEDLRQAGRQASGVLAHCADSKRWFRTPAALGWSVTRWPVEWGGCDGSSRQHDIFACKLAEAEADADAPALASLCPGRVAPVLPAFGSPEQQPCWMPGIRSGIDYWAPGYSEPGAESDLASLQCRAQRRAGPQGNELLINGSKTVISVMRRNPFIGLPETTHAFDLHPQLDRRRPGPLARHLLALCRRRTAARRRRGA